MFTVNRIYIHIIVSGKGHNYMASCHKSFFIGKSNIFSCFDSFNCRYYSHHTHYSRYNNICLLINSTFNKSFTAIYNFNVCIFKKYLKFLRSLSCTCTHQLRFKLPCLLLQLADSCTCCQGCNLKILIIPYYIKGLGTNRTC